MDLDLVMKAETSNDDSILPGHNHSLLMVVITFLDYVHTHTIYIVGHYVDSGFFLLFQTHHIWCTPIKIYPHPRSYVRPFRVFSVPLRNCFPLFFERGTK